MNNETLRSRIRSREQSSPRGECTPRESFRRYALFDLRRASALQQPSRRAFSKSLQVNAQTKNHFRGVPSRRLFSTRRYSMADTKVTRSEFHAHLAVSKCDPDDGGSPNGFGTNANAFLAPPHLKRATPAAQTVIVPLRFFSCLKEHLTKACSPRT